MKRRSIGLENGGVWSATCSATRFCPRALLESPRGDDIRDALVRYLAGSVLSQTVLLVAQVDF